MRENREVQQDDQERESVSHLHEIHLQESRIRSTEGRHKELFKD